MQDASKTREIEQIKLVSENQCLKEKMESINNKLNKSMTSTTFTGVSLCLKN